MEETWQFTPVFLPGESCDQRSLVGYGPWDRKEPAMTQATEQSIAHMKPEMKFMVTVMRIANLWWKIIQ